MATKIFRTVLFIVGLVLSYVAYQDGRPDVGIVFLVCTGGYLLTVVLEQIFSKKKMVE